MFNLFVSVTFQTLVFFLVSIKFGRRFSFLFLFFLFVSFSILFSTVLSSAEVGTDNVACIDPDPILTS